MSDDLSRFENLTYDDFRRLATDETLTPYERIGFPTSYREGKEELIFDDLLRKLPALDSRDRRVLDVGPGCSTLPRLLIDHCAARGHELILVDSSEMLEQLPDAREITKLAGSFPDEQNLQGSDGTIDVAIVYSVLHYVFAEGNLFAFLDRLLALLAPGGAALLGDIPNVSKRRRFFASSAGIAFHKEFMQTDDAPPATFNEPAPGAIDDAVVFSLLARARAAGCDAYVVPQPQELPMANRREDVLITRP